MNKQKTTYIVSETYDAESATETFAVAHHSDTKRVGSDYHYYYTELGPKAYAKLINTENPEKCRLAFFSEDGKSMGEYPIIAAR